MEKQLGSTLKHASPEQIEEWLHTLTSNERKLVEEWSQSLRTAADKRQSEDKQPDAGSVLQALKTVAKAALDKGSDIGSYFNKEEQNELQKEMSLKDGF